jgi:hypothetical protein
VERDPRTAVSELQQTDRWIGPLARFALGSCFAKLDAIATWYALRLTTPARRQPGRAVGLRHVRARARARPRRRARLRRARAPRVGRAGAPAALVIWGMVAISNLTQIVYVQVRWG